MNSDITGTIAIDLGNSNTVCAFQSENENSRTLIDIPGITISAGIVPTMIWSTGVGSNSLIGLEAMKLRNHADSDKYFHSNFKRLIGNPIERRPNKILSPKESGEQFIKTLWQNIPDNLKIKRLVLTAPIDTYRGYRQWLIDVFSDLSIPEIALVDEPTAAGIGINVPFGSKIMVIDIGGSTIDMNIVELEGGEGKAAPIAELLRFNDQDISNISKQKLRCAKVISKSASKLGGQDIDKWIVKHFICNYEDERNLAIAEKIKCLISDKKIKEDKTFITSFFIDKEIKKDFFISKEILEEILKQNNFLNHLDSLLKSLFNEARGKNFYSKDLHSILLVGGGTQIPQVKHWLESTLSDIPINIPPPVEAVALGALSLTPGVKIQDVLNKGFSIKIYNKKEDKNIWHPIFFKGQTWPTEQPFEIILQASRENQTKFEIEMGETISKNKFDIIFEDGLPKLSEIQPLEKTIPWGQDPIYITIEQPFSLGKDCLKLIFWINDKGNLKLRCLDVNDNEIGNFLLGNVQ